MLDMAPYAALKSGINGVMNVSQQNTAPKDLWVNSILPGGADTHGTFYCFQQRKGSLQTIATDLRHTAKE